MSVYYTDPADERRKEIRQVLAGTRQGAAFDVSLAKATELLTLFPEAGRPYPDESTRRYALSRAPCSLIYRVAGQDVYILAIVSQRRGE